MVNVPKSIVLLILLCSLGVCFISTVPKYILKHLEAFTNKAPQGYEEYAKTKDAFRELGYNISKIYETKSNINDISEFSAALSNSARGKSDPFGIKDKVYSYYWTTELNKAYSPSEFPLLWKHIHLYYPEVIYLSWSGNLYVTNANSFYKKYNLKLNSTSQ